MEYARIILPVESIIVWNARETEYFLHPHPYHCEECDTTYFRVAVVAKDLIKTSYATRLSNYLVTKAEAKLINRNRRLRNNGEEKK